MGQDEIWHYMLPELLDWNRAVGQNHGTVIPRFEQAGDAFPERIEEGGIIGGNH